MRDIREWRSYEIARAHKELRRSESRIRPVVLTPIDIDFRRVEAAVLLHAEAGLLLLEEGELHDAKVHLDASAGLFQWSRRVAAGARNWETMRGYAFQDRPAVPEPRESIDPRDFYVAVASASLALGFAEPASTFAQMARKQAPFDRDVQMIWACAASGLAAEKALRRQDASRALADADKGFRAVLALDADTHEARLRLGKLLLDRDRLAEAETLLAESEARAADDRQRYLARLFLARAAERRGHPEEAIGWYRRALEAWPGSQAARFGLAQALERSTGPSASREVVGAILDPPGVGAPPDPWFVYFIGPPGLAKDVYDRVFHRPRP